jgi:hypothetical protein
MPTTADLADFQQGADEPETAQVRLAILGSGG